MTVGPWSTTQLSALVPPRQPLLSLLEPLVTAFCLRTVYWQGKNQPCLLGWHHSQEEPVLRLQKGAEGSILGSLLSGEQGIISQHHHLPGSFSDPLNNNLSGLSTLSPAQGCKLLPAQAEPTLTSVLVECRCHAHNFKKVKPTP